MKEQITVEFDRLPPFGQKMGLELTPGAEYVGTRAAGSGDPFDFSDDTGRAFRLVRPALSSPYCRELPPRQVKWDRRYIELARTVATWSKDPSTKVGAVLVRPNNSVASTGFNGFPPGADDSPRLYADREYKYKHVIHAERNALNFLAGSGETPAGFSVYTSFPCCPDCVEALGRAGVRRAVSPPLPVEGKPPEWVEFWRGLLRESREVAARYGLVIEEVEG